ncbi:carboxymuconolactone decarboxylase family protein, partial [Mycobacteroides abscessus]|nr:carboxymuconolactone decarboxylase family protein [Mycobacteroides abscessus]
MSSGRIPSGGLRELGPINWVIAKGMARAVNAPEMHLATTLGQTGA